MGAFVAGAAAMGALLLGFCVCLTILMARVNGEVAKVLSESLERVFWPKGEPQRNLEPEPQHSVTQAMEDEEETRWPEPPWETEDMSPYEPSSVADG